MAIDPFTIAMLGGTAASVGSGILGQRAAGQAAGAQSNAAMMSAIIQAQQAEAARRQQQEMFDKAVALQEPFRQGGVGATNRLADLYGTSGRTGAEGYGSYAEMPSINQLQMDPGYQFRFEQGMRGVNASAAARAGLQSGAALKAATEFGQGMGTQEYQNAYNRFMANRQQASEAMSGLAGRGAGVAQGLGQQAVSTGANMANTMLAGGQALGQGLENVGQARASGYMGGASALSQALQAPAQNYLAYSMMDRFAPQGAASIGGFNKNAGMAYGPQLSDNTGAFGFLGF
jgi:hypothetical protein